MKIAHLADLHLGHRRYPQRDSNGRNQRSTDVLNACRALWQDLTERKPDAILIAGDIFDGPRPAAEAITVLVESIRAFRRACPATPIIMIEGNHDRGRIQMDGSILDLFAMLGCEVVKTRSRWIALPGLDILAVPEHCAHVSDLTPDLNPSGYQVLLLHGEIAGVIPSADFTVVSIPADRIQSPQWDYVALGHWHVTQEVAPRCWYAGSLDYVSSNPWQELKSEARLGLSGKGYLMVDLATRTVERIPIATRRWHDLPRIDATGMSTEEIRAQLNAHVAAVDITGAVVRQTILSVPRAYKREVQGFLTRAWKLSAFHFVLDVRLCAEEHAIRIGELERMRTASLEELLRDSLMRRELPADIMRADFVAAGERYYDEAATVSVADDDPTPTEEVSDAA